MHRIHRTDNPGNERMWRDHGADIRGAMITRIGSTELITPEMIGCGYKGIYNHTHRIHRTDNPGNERNNTYNENQFILIKLL